VHSLSYEQAQAILNRSDTAPPFEDVELLRGELRVLLEISRKLKAARVARGALELHSEEVGFQIERSTNAPLQIKPHDHLEVNSLVEEFMLVANESVARRIHQSYPSTALLRRHPFPAQSRFRQLVKCAEAAGITLDASSNKALAKSLNSVHIPGSPHASEILKTLATRAMAEAEYFCTGLCERPEQFYHYGLASDFYTHFTSPIRRYADVTVHRLLIRALTGEESAGMTPGELQAMADHMNGRHHASRRAQKDAMLLFQVFYFAARDNVVADAIVYSVRKNALLVHIPLFQLKGTVFLFEKDGTSVLQNPNSPSETIPASDIAVFVDRQIVEVTVAKEKHVLKPFDKICVRISTEQSRSHKPDIKLKLVSLPKQSQGSGGGQQVGKHEMVASVFGQQQKAASTPSSKAKTLETSHRSSLYTFLQKLSRPRRATSATMAVVNAVPQSGVPVAKKKGKDKRGEDKTVRRWALTAVQLKHMEDEKTPTARPSWMDDTEAGQVTEQDTRGILEQRAIQQVRDAAHQRYKQQQRKK
jgi:DIS3-like exonuclease 1